MIKLGDISELPLELQYLFMKLSVEERADLLVSIEHVTHIVIDDYAFPLNSSVYRYFERD